jgi:hypothetical protein
MARVRYESKETAGRQFWTGRYGGCAIWIDAYQPGVNRWLITLEGGLSPDPGSAMSSHRGGRERAWHSPAAAQWRFVDAKRIERW